MTDFDADVATMRAFASYAGSVRGRISGLTALSEAARLAPGTFTQTSGGRRLDGVHSVVLGRITALVTNAAQQISAGVDKISASADEYESADALATDRMHRIRKGMEP